MLDARLELMRSRDLVRPFTEKAKQAGFVLVAKGRALDTADMPDLRVAIYRDLAGSDRFLTHQSVPIERHPKYTLFDVQIKEYRWSELKMLLQSRQIALDQPLRRALGRSEF